MERWPENQLQVLFNFQRILCKNKSEEASMLIWINFDSFCYYISNISRLLKKFHFPLEVNFFQIQKGLELVFRLHLLQNFLMKLFLLEYDINWSNCINWPCLLLKLFSKMYFLFCAQTFDDVMKSKNLKFDFLKIKKSF